MLTFSDSIPGLTQKKKNTALACAWIMKNMCSVLRAWLIEELVAGSIALSCQL
jgi:hypothetical protein